MKMKIFSFACLAMTLFSQEKTMFIDPSNPLLKQRAAEVLESEINSPEIEVIIEKMYEMSGGERIDPTNGH